MNDHVMHIIYHLVHVRTYSGLLSGPPDDIVITQLSSTSFAINWLNTVIYVLTYILV